MIASMLSVCLFVLLAASNVDASESELRRAIFENYDKLVRPVTSYSDTVPVRASLVPVAVKDVDVKDKIVKLDTWFYMQWENKLLRWDPSLHDGIDALRIPASEVWKPDIIVYSSTPDTHSIPSVQTNVVLYSNGTALWIPPFTVKSRCPVTEGQVDGDTFKCTITVGSWTYDTSLLDVHEYHQDVLEYAKRGTYQDTHEKWTLDSMTARTEQIVYSCCPEPYSTLKFDLQFKKKHAEEHDH